MEENRPCRNTKSKLKTLCTIDTSDIDLSELKIGSSYHRIDRSKAKPDKKMSSQSRSKPKYKTPKNAPTKMQFNYSLKKSPIVKQTAGTHFRHKTQYQREESHSSRKKIVYPFDPEYNIQSYKIINKVAESALEKVLLGECTKTSKLYIIKKTKSQAKRIEYQQQIKVRTQLMKLPSHIRKTLSKVRHYQKLPHQLTLIYPNYGTCLSFDNSAHLQLMKKAAKEDMAILRFITIEVAKAINGLSQLGLVHGSVKLQNVFLQLEERGSAIKMEKIVKLGNFKDTFHFHKKKNMLLLGQNVYTPPEIINLMMFQSDSEHFDRQLLEHFTTGYDDPWKIDIWALGIMILQILLLNSLPALGTSLSTTLTLQLDLLRKYQHALQPLKHNEIFYNLLTRMLSSNPNTRPHPKELIYNL